MSPKEKLMGMIASRPKKEPKTKKIKEIIHWDDAMYLYYPNYPRERYSPKSIKIYEAIVSIIDKETAVSSRDYVYWFLENYELLTKKHMPSVDMFSLTYKDYLAKFIKSRETKSLRVRR